ncbi:hypothetical protein [Bartonella koehlerae]|nr:hypothetical protein [Bartonella koehlerae]
MFIPMIVDEMLEGIVVAPRRCWGCMRRKNSKSFLMIFYPFNLTLKLVALWDLPIYSQYFFAAFCMPVITTFLPTRFFSLKPDETIEARTRFIEGNVWSFRVGVLVCGGGCVVCGGGGILCIFLQAFGVLDVCL